MPHRPRAVAIAAALASAVPLTPAEADAASPVLAPASSQQHALAVQLTDGAEPAVEAHACASARGCTSSGSDRYPLPPEADPAKAQIELVGLGAGKTVAVVTAPLRQGPGSWTLVLTASSPPSAPAVQLKLLGVTERPSGKIPGQRKSTVLLREPAASGERLLLGRRFENASLCGRAASMRTEELDPADMEWRASHARPLSLSELANAPRLEARPSDAPFDVDQPRILYGVLASSAVGRERSGLTDRDLTTRWAEDRDGNGRGEYLVMNAPEAVPVTGFEVVLGSASAGPRAADPRTFYIASRSQVFAVELPSDGAIAAEGGSYLIDLPAPQRSDCYAVVLADADVAAERDEVGISELRARTRWDGKTLDDLIAALGRPEDADEATAVLERSGDRGTAAAARAYASLGDEGRRAALRVIDAGSCAAATPFFIERVLGDGAGDNFEPSLDTLARHARDRLRGCRSTSTPALIEELKSRSGQQRVWAARELADLSPADAVTSIMGVLDASSTAPAKPGGADVVRRGLRAALAIAAERRRARDAVASLLEQEAYAQLSLVKRIDLLRALGPRIATHEGARTALQAVLASDGTMRTRFLLLQPASHLAESGDAAAVSWLDERLRSDESRHVRARAAAVSAGLAPLAPALQAALGDSEPRVREAALEALADSGEHVDRQAEARMVGLLASDPWTFVRAGAARALGGRPPSETADRALVAALQDESSLVRRSVLRALGRRGSKAGGDAVHAIADDPREPVPVRIAAIAALGTLCRSESADLLTKLALRAGSQELPYDKPLGMAALAALGELKPVDLQERLAPLLTRGSRVPELVRAVTRDALTRPSHCGK